MVSTAAATRGCQMVDVLSAKAGSFIDSAAGSGRPFMLEVATFAPHAPFIPRPVT